MRKRRLQATLVIAVITFLAACDATDPVAPVPPETPFELEVDLSGNYRGSLHLSVSDTTCMPTGGPWSYCRNPSLVSLQCTLEGTVTGTGSFFEVPVSDWTSGDLETRIFYVQSYDMAISVDWSGCHDFGEDLPPFDSIVTLGTMATLQLDVQHVRVDAQSEVLDAPDPQIGGNVAGVDLLGLTGCERLASSPGGLVITPGNFSARSAHHLPAHYLHHSESDLAIKIIAYEPGPCFCMREVQALRLQLNLERIP